MRFWLIKDGEPLPTNGASRLLRTGLLAEYLARQGHEVIWWTSSFDHFQRSQHDLGPAPRVSPNLELRLLPGPGYRRNVSLGRILHHRRVARAFLRAAAREPAPDAILCAMPSIELSEAAVELGKARNIPVILDLRDLWPDIFIDVLPPLFRPLARPAVLPFERPLRRACRGAKGLWGITPDFLNWGLDLADREPGKHDSHFWHLYTDYVPTAEESGNARAFWKSCGLSESDFIVCFLGSLSLELEPVLAAARGLSADRRLRFVLCGTGDKIARYRTLVEGVPSVLLPGWIDRPRIAELLKMAKVAVAPYPDRADFRMSIPNKAIEYLAAGLPVLSSLKGTFERFIDDNQCGLQYAARDHRDFARKLMTLVENEGERKRLGQNARLAYEREFRADGILARMAASLEAVKD